MGGCLDSIAAAHTANCFIAKKIDMKHCKSRKVAGPGPHCSEMDSFNFKKLCNLAPVDVSLTKTLM